MRRLTALSAVGLALILGVAYTGLGGVWQQVLQLPPNGAVLQVTPGESLGQVLRKVEKKGWLNNAVWVGRIASWSGRDLDIRAGEFYVQSDMTVAGLIEHLASGSVMQYSITIPEGLTLSRAISILSLHPKLVTTPEPLLKRELAAWVAPARYPEGWFLPETWSFTAGDTVLDILARSHAAMRQLLDTLWQHRPQELPLNNPYEALILASIVERETAAPEERIQITGVFLRRLQRGMRLQTDPTVIYGLADKYDGNLKRKHLRDAQNPYNTYAIKGLPPTPIALPGEASLRAVFSHDDSDNLYFVAKGDGTHAFSSTLKEHEKNVQLYQLTRRADYRSTPPVDRVLEK